MRKLNTGEILLEKDDILLYLKNRPPLLLIDSARVMPGKYSISERRMDPKEWFFSCHFPGNPMMPGVLQLETSFQTAAMAIKTLDGYQNKTTNIAQINSVKYKTHIRPNDEILVDTKVIRFRRGLANMDAKITCNGLTCCEASFLLVVLDDIPQLEDNNEFNE